MVALEGYVQENLSNGTQNLYLQTLCLKQSISNPVTLV